jgi:hypothetical protein
MSRLQPLGHGTLRYVVMLIATKCVLSKCNRCQTSLKGNGKPLGFIIYADKSKLSSFGTIKGYPVMAGISNLAMQLRNGSGLGAGRIVGWLPVVSVSFHLMVKSQMLGIY